MSYEKVKKWRESSPERKKYPADYMRNMRKYYKTLWKAGKIKYEDIPVSYRYWVKEKKTFSAK